MVGIFQRRNIRVRRAQDFFEAEFVERAEPDALGPLADGFYNAILHLAGSFVCKRQPENIFARELGIRFQQVANAFGDDARLPCARASDDKQRPIAVLHSAALLVVERKSFLRGCV